jgi:DNA-binding MarR family transcriptional regulator
MKTLEENQQEISSLFPFKPGVSMPTLIARTAQTIRAYLAKTITDSGIDLTPEEAMALSLIARFEGQSVNSLSDSLVKDRTTVTRMLNSMSERNLIERQKNPTDRRSYKIVLTTKGRKVFTYLDPILMKAQENLVEGLQSDELFAAIRVVQSMQARAWDVTGDF